MFGDMMGQMQEMQAKMQEKLSQMEVTESAGGNLIHVTVNGIREIINISIDPSLLGGDDAEAIEDMLVVATNRALEKAAKMEAEEGQNMMQGMMPDGLAGLM